MYDSGMAEAPDWASPPGHTIVTILDERELTVEQFAHQIGRSTSVAQRIIDGAHAIDRDLARNLAFALGASEKFWMAREHDYRASVTPRDSFQIGSLAELIGKLPVNDMQNFGWIGRAGSTDDKIAECLSFFDVSTLAQWQGRYENAFQEAAYRRSTAHNSCEVATTAWLRQGEIETQGDVVASWSAAVLETQIEHFKRLTWYKSPALFLPKAKSLFAAAGVKFAIVRAPKGCTASGAVRVLSDGTPHVQLSFRFLSDDQFWFSLFHEIAHLLLHYERMPILENSETAGNQTESEANEYAANTIIPPEFHDELFSLSKTKNSIINFAKKVGVCPGLIVGRLQRERVIGYNQMQHLKRRFVWLDHPLK
ncbi:ImmA/IrrE family metallo-endopeptidase [Sphingomonas sp. AR_OL41]|uniref:ImmA/IrrE family metallo-endopeptidase n=1 Tax=Sphingomonas sp. AR_OL41 TaxID=3042729 RepID=UPI0024812BD5|nr:ImmA/IrrE family metallo-endopeptidase [Sphingomonas sp. AR_OL41]MDH7971466.1 ImmA/IrrE family metallo-endopeptidase [Sphingomonas sp. AR_OL41]